MENRNKLVIMITRGFDDERSSVAWSVANGALNSGMDLTIFLTSSGIDWVRKGAADDARLNPFDPPMVEMINRVMENGKVLACPPCVKVRGIKEDDLLDGVIVVGSGAMHEEIKKGAATLCF